MDYEDRVTIQTPEGVTLELTLAGIGSRMLSAMADLTIQGIVWTICGLLLSGGNLGLAVLSILAFVIVFGYDVAFEVLAAGRTPGKRMAGLRVVREGGRRVDLVTSAIRNVLRIVDFLPGLYAVGMVSVLASARNQRLGDLAAGTLIVRERRVEPAGEVALPEPGSAAAWDVSGVRPEDMAVVRSFLARRSQLDPAAASALAGELAQRLRPLVAGAPEHLDPLRFLELVAAAKAARE